MYSTISISQLLNERKRLFSRILMECVPSAERFLEPLLRAMHNSFKLKMMYQQYYDVVNIIRQHPDEFPEWHSSQRQSCTLQPSSRTRKNPAGTGSKNLAENG